MVCGSSLAVIHNRAENYFIWLRKLENTLRAFSGHNLKRLIHKLQNILNFPSTKLSRFNKRDKWQFCKAKRNVCHEMKKNKMFVLSSAQLISLGRMSIYKDRI